MKIVLSRKGFDSSVGGHASPILPDGTMVSLPIPSTLDRLGYESLHLPDGRTYRALIDELNARARIDGKGAHLDPDLVRDARPRRDGWRAAFGQTGSAAGHLRNQRVTVGDLFLFYGWFRDTTLDDGRLRFVRGDGMHVIYGYLEVGEVLRTQCCRHVPSWLRDHPHVLPQRIASTNNTIYIASERLNGDATLSGAGVFRFDGTLVLTKPGEKRSRWRLPAPFRRVAISYHDRRAWCNGYFQSYPRAQEYVIRANDAVMAWARELVRSASRSSGQEGR
jgi:hypothetical protein